MESSAALGASVGSEGAGGSALCSTAAAFGAGSVVDGATSGVAMSSGAPADGSAAGGDSLGASTFATVGTIGVGEALPSLVPVSSMFI